MSAKNNYGKFSNYKFYDRGRNQSNVIATVDSTHKEQRNGSAFAVIKQGGSVITWGYSGSNRGADSSSVNLSSGVTNIFSTANAFAALKNDGLKSAQNALYLTSKIQQAFPEVPEDLEEES